MTIVVDLGCGAKMRQPGFGDHPAAGIISCVLIRSMPHDLHEGYADGSTNPRRWLDSHSCAVTDRLGENLGHAPEPPPPARAPGARPATRRAIERRRARAALKPSPKKKR